MAEVALGALGVVPLVGVAIKGYRILSSKLKTLRHHDAALKRVCRRLTTQRRIFLFENERILQHCLGDDVLAGAMMQSPDHHHWTNDQLEPTCRRTLKDDFEEWAELLREIAEAIRRFDSELEKFEKIVFDVRPGEKLRTTLKRLEDGMKISWSQSTYEANLAELRVNNSDLKSLREQVCTITSSNPTLSLKRPIVCPVSNWAEVRVASMALHKSLAGAWSCNQANHTHHLVKLFLETEKGHDDTIRMNIAILTQEHTFGQGACKPSVTQFQVRSILLSTIPRLPSPTVSEDDQDHRPRKKKKAVRFEGTMMMSNLPQASARVASRMADSSLDLRDTSDFCFTLAKNCKMPAIASSYNCLGFLTEGTENRYRHMFYSADAQGSLCMADESPLFQMDAVLCDPNHDVLSRLDRLRLARSLTIAVLKFHETPWLKEEWRLQDLSFFYNERDVLRSLRTLHLRAAFDRQSAKSVTQSDSCWLPSTPSSSNLSQVTEDERLMYGLDNLALYCLGVALLQIERGTQVHPEDMLSVRKMAKTSSTFGWTYRELVDKCVRCDFGYGADLSQERLLKAVYENVVGGLDGLITAFAVIDLRS